MDVNFISYVSLTQAFTPFLLSKSTPTSIILLVHNLRNHRFDRTSNLFVQYIIASGFGACAKNPRLLSR